MAVAVNASARAGALGAATTLPVRLLLRLYRLVVSPLVGPACRFEPSCSRYAEDALERFGLAKGGLMALRRLARCHPWNPGGFDPVAERER